LEKDPQEVNDIASMSSDRVAKLRSKLDQWWTP